MKKPSAPSLLRAAAATACLGVAALSAFAQADQYPTMPPRNPPLPSEPAEPVLPSGDHNIDAPLPDDRAQRFITEVSLLQSEEARLSVIAGQRATRDQVRIFAEQMRSATQDRDDELARLAQRRNVILPTGRDARNAAEDNEEWRRKDPQYFDVDYLRRIIRIQRNAIDRLEDYANAADSDPELAAFAQRHLPAVRENLRQAQMLEEQVQ